MEQQKEKQKGEKPKNIIYAKGGQGSGMRFFQDDIMEQTCQCEGHSLDTDPPQYVETFTCQKCKQKGEKPKNIIYAKGGQGSGMRFFQDDIMEQTCQCEGHSLDTDPPQYVETFTCQKCKQKDTKCAKGNKNSGMTMYMNKFVKYYVRYNHCYDDMTHIQQEEFRETLGYN